eukprot:15440632-Alexandrium_andersonii.AAC.1
MIQSARGTLWWSTRAGVVISAGGPSSGTPRGRAPRCGGQQSRPSRRQPRGGLPVAPRLGAASGPGACDPAPS